MNTPKQYFDNYINKVYPNEILNERQLRELSLAFYAGMFVMVDFAAITPDNEEQSDVIMEDFMGQLKQTALETNGAF